MTDGRHRPTGSSFGSHGPKAREAQEKAPGLATEGRFRALFLGLNQLSLGLLETTRPEQQHAEMKAHRRSVREDLHERAELGERVFGMGLVEKADGGCDLRLGVVRAVAAALAYWRSAESWRPRR